MPDSLNIWSGGVKVRFLPVTLARAKERVRGER